MTEFRLYPEDGAPATVVAEMSNAHNGEERLAHELLDGIKASGASAVKFQCYTPDELVALRGDGPAPEPWGAQGLTMRALYEQARTPLAWFPPLIQHCHDLGLPWFASVFGPASLAAMQVLGCPVYKLASLDRRSTKLRAAVLATGRPVVRSLPYLYPPRAEPSELLLYCPPGYPQERIDMAVFRRRYHGFSYHGTNPLVPATAAASGARILEVHVQDDDRLSVLEANVSLTLDQLRALVLAVGALA